MTHPTDPQLWPANVSVTDGVLDLAGLSVTELAATYGTPSFLLDVADLRGRAARYRDALAGAFAPLGVDVDVYYASKAFLSTAVARWVHAEGLRIDTAAHGELATAIAAGVPGADIGLHGNNKSAGEITLALEHGVGRIVVDSLPEIDLVGSIAARLGVRAPVMVRVTTGVHAGGHEFIATAHEDQKFGLSLASGAAAQALDRIHADDRLDLLGLHSHIGSQILDPAGFGEAARALLRLRADFAGRTGVLLPEMDLGGGFGIAYLPTERGVDVAALATDLAEILTAEARVLGTPLPRLSFEPGRAIVGPAMITLYTVGTVKDVVLDDGGTRLYVSVDGGMSDNIRTALYDADYHAELTSRSSTAPRVRSRVVGKHCESGDIVVRDVLLPADLAAGDLLAVPATGAYGRSMASNYNMVPRAGVVAVEDGQAREIVRRETIEDVLALDMG
ncbi:diaminopimelate decarboxylase [Occultella glacieicola]|uniref:Diaminopimelate decarboxylase n=1 Tax=Occultella glacieicola TaxID=2518684 RepID=A0ABY2E619_9MICO|nr:diaminopimelate decarboxylase [Occultella glacieicola]TDE96038.1 diaminopimelate decarboxylase [Occultella glacieicola]